MSDNPIQFIKNPNSPAAIQLRLDGYADTTPYNQVRIIQDPKAKTIFLDLTKEQVHQRLSYTNIGGHNNSKRLVRTSFSMNDEKRQIITLYYTDVFNSQWVIIKDYTDKLPPNTASDLTSDRPHPHSTYGGTFGGFFASAPGENWRNQDRSADEIHDAERRQYQKTPIDPNSDNEVEHPEEGLFNPDFTGTK